MKRIKLLTPVVLGVTSLTALVPLASCSTSANHIAITIAGKSKAAESGEFVYYIFKLDRDNYVEKDFEITLEGEHTSDLSVKPIVSNDLLLLKVGCEEPYDAEATYNFKVTFKTSSWNESISDIQLTITNSSQLKQVTEINSFLKAQEELGNIPSTMSGLISLLKTNEIDLENLTTLKDTQQWVWDCDKNIVFVMNSDGTIATAPKDYSLNKFKSNIWKMVKAPSSLRLALASNSNAAKDEFATDCKYSQYLRSDETFNNKELTFHTGLDTGVHTGFTLTFEKDSTITEDQPAAIINTNKSSLTVNSELNDIEHHGNLTKLTIDQLPEDGTYTEFGTVDATITIKSGSLVAEEGSDINTILVDSDDVGTITIDQNSDVGTVYASTEVKTKSTEDFIDPESTGQAETVEQTKIDVSEAKYAAGSGTERSPYAISNVDQLKNCSSDVNSASRETDVFYFKLIADIDMSSVNEWTPIGATSATPFQGIFDGNGFTIKNLKLVKTVTAETYGFGLFGYVMGGTYNGFTSIDQIWQDNKLQDEMIDETLYPSIVKNITLEKVDIEISGDARSVGGIVGRAEKCFISNNKVKSGKIIGNKTVGGIAGTCVQSICIDCMCGDDAEQAVALEVTANTYNSGGILGMPQYKTTASADVACIKCSTGANTTISALSNTNGGATGGIVGSNQSCQVCLIDQCTNKASIVVKNTADTTTSRVAGICGFGESFSVIANCTNDGTITIPENNKVGLAGGIAASCTTLLLYNCTNNKEINGYATVAMAGIAAGCYLADTSKATQITQCVNNGQLTNTCSNPTYPTADIASGMTSVKFENITFSDINDLNNKIKSVASTTTKFEFKNCTITAGSTGSIELPTTISTIVADKPLSDNIAVKTDSKNLTINIPNQNVTIDTQSDCSIVSIAENNTITINEGAIINSVSVRGSNSKVINKGTVTRTIGIDGASLSGQNDGTCANITFGYGTGNEITCDKSFINNGEITGLCSSSAKNNNVIYAKSEQTTATTHNIYIENNGIIQYQNNSLSTPANFFQIDAQFTHIEVKCITGSTIKTDTLDKWFSIFNNSDSILFKHQTGTTLQENGSDLTYADLAAKSRYVTEESI